MKISEVCSIHSGYTARGKLDALVGGGVPALQLRDVGADGLAPISDLPRYDLGDLPSRYFVSGGEVVFRSRGELNVAAAIGPALAEPIAIILPLVILRPEPARVLPEYLAWAINQPDAQRQLDAEAQGTGLRMIPMVALENLDIPVPSLLSQARIGELSSLARQEWRLLRELAERRNDLVSAILSGAARAATNKENFQ